MSKLLSLIISIWFNLRYLPFKEAIKFPIVLDYRTKYNIKSRKRIIIDAECHPFMIRIGFHAVPVVPESKTALFIDGKLVFNGTAHIGKGSRIVVWKDALLELGDNFAISSASYINCFKHIKTGKDIQLAWGDLLMDSDTHTIFDEEGKVINEDGEIILGDKIWMGCDCKVLKGSIIPDNCVIGANSVVTEGSRLDANSLIVGCPAKSVKKIKGFRI